MADQNTLSLVREAFHTFGEEAARQLGADRGLTSDEIAFCCDGRDHAPSKDGTALVVGDLH